MMISFCIISIGDKPDKLRLSVESICRNFSSKDDYEIIIVGNNISQFSDLNVTLIEDNEHIEFLGKRRNIATENSKGDILVHFDDDMIFPEDWFEKFNQFNENNKDWEILGNKILLPDGKRHWDRATYLPNHIMVDYDYESDSDIFYQTGGFCIAKRTLLDEVKWRDDLPFYAMFKGFPHNEDVDFSIRLNKAGKKIWFDKNNKVWHYDHSYHSDNLTCNKKRDISAVNFQSLEFICLINNLTI